MAEQAPEEVKEEPPVFVDGEQAVERIKALVETARAAWFVLLGYLAFVGTTLLGVQDIDFFSATSSTQLPLVGISIPTMTFFLVAPILGAALHVYLHLYLVKLWDALAEAPPTVGTTPLGDRVFPWLVVDWALRLRPDQAIETRPLDQLGNWVMAGIVWLAGPIVLGWFWWRSATAHDPWLTLVIAAAFGVSLYASFRGWRQARACLRHAGRSPPTPQDALIERWGLMQIVLLLIVFSWLRTEGPISLNMLARIDLTGAEIAARPADWLGRDTAEQRFRADWCADRGLPPDACAPPPHAPYQSEAREAWCQERKIDDCPATFQKLDEAFDSEWAEQLGEYLANIVRPDLRGRDLRRAAISGAFLAGIDLRGARLQGANLSNARLEGANLSEARMEEANLSYARLEGTNLLGARLEGANLWGARLEGSDLTLARLEGADLSLARLERTNLLGARLDGADLSLARLEEANLTQARLEGANLHSAHLAGSELFLARMEVADLYRARLEGANLIGARLDGANLTEARLQGADLSNARLEGANLTKARLEGANFSNARLEVADIYPVRMSEADLSNAQFQSADWTGATFGPTAAHSTDFAGGTNLTQKQLVQVIGDEDTILPLDAETGEQLHVWSCWEEDAAEAFVQLRTQHNHWPTADDLWQVILDNAWICADGMAPLAVLGKR